jgi:hypothetical protein
MRILINSTGILPSPPKQYGGIEWIVWLLADGLTNQHGARFQCTECGKIKGCKRHREPPNSQKK